MKSATCSIILWWVILSLLVPPVAIGARIKDIAAVEGVRDNQLIGFGLVVGLDKTGDSVVGGQFTAQAIISMLNAMGIIACAVN